jgi:hypothetical protein
MSDLNDRDRALAGAAVGALLGGAAAFLLFTPRGRQVLANINPALDDVSALLSEFRRALRKGQAVAHDARAAADDLKTVLAGDNLPAGV